MIMEIWHRGFKTLNTLHASYKHKVPDEHLDKQHQQAEESSGPHYLQPLVNNK
jgi:hypothetical protein